MQVDFRFKQISRSYKYFFNSASDVAQPAGSCKIKYFMADWMTLNI